MKLDVDVANNPANGRKHPREEGFMKRSIFGTLAALATSVSAQAQTQTPIKIGILNDQSGIYADLAGPGSVFAARLAVEDVGGKVLGRPVAVAVADHQGKPDIGANVARRWYEMEGEHARPENEIARRIVVHPQPRQSDAADGENGSHHGKPKSGAI
jgi:hypothetical protein